MPRRRKMPPRDLDWDLLAVKFVLLYPELAKRHNVPSSAIPHYLFDNVQWIDAYLSAFEQLGCGELNGAEGDQFTLALNRLRGGPV